MDRSNSICAPDLFGSTAIHRTGKMRRASPVELQVAGALCRQPRRKSGRREKQRIVHLICLNLVSMLKSRRQPESTRNG
jgi:hypothetical protein